MSIAPESSLELVSWSWIQFYLHCEVVQRVLDLNDHSKINVCFHLDIH